MGITRVVRWLSRQMSQKLIKTLSFVMPNFLVRTHLDKFLPVFSQKVGPEHLRLA